jgi:hypothetical protein
VANSLRLRRASVRAAGSASRGPVRAAGLEPATLA